MKALVVSTNYAVPLSSRNRNRLGAIPPALFIGVMAELGASDVMWGKNSGETLFFTCEETNLQKIIQYVTTSIG